MLNIKSILVLIASLILCSCSSDSEPTLENPRLDVSSTSMTTNSQGFATTTFQVEPGITSFQVITRSNTANVIGLAELRGPAGEILLSGTEESISGATDFASINTLNYPTNAKNPNLESGTYTITYLAGVNRGDSLGGDLLDLSILKKSDSDTSTGTTLVNVIFAGPLANDDKLQDSMFASLEDTRSILQNIGVELIYNFIEAPELPSAMPDPATGSLLYEQYPLSKGISQGIMLYLAIEVNGTQGSFSSCDDRTSKVGSSPLPFLMTPQSAIVVSVLGLAGSDGLFDEDGDQTVPFFGNDFLRINDEIGLAGQQMAHDFGRAFGLFNTVEFNGQVATLVDALPDTPNCSSQRGCSLDRFSREHVMFPCATIRNGSRSDLTGRTRWSEQQREVVNAYVGIS